MTSKRRRIDSFGSRSSKNWKAASRQRSGVCLPEVSLSQVSRDMVTWCRVSPFASRMTTSKTRESCSAVRRTWIMSVSLGIRAPSASQAVNPVVRQSARPSVLSASHAVHPVGVRQQVEAHQSKDEEHNHGAHDPHDAHFGFLSVLFILVWHRFLLNYDLTVCLRAETKLEEILFVSAYVSLTAVKRELRQH